GATPEEQRATPSKRADGGRRQRQPRGTQEEMRGDVGTNLEALVGEDPEPNEQGGRRASLSVTRPKATDPVARHDRRRTHGPHGHSRREDQGFRLAGRAVCREDSEERQKEKVQQRQVVLEVVSIRNQPTGNGVGAVKGLELVRIEALDPEQE